MLPQPHGAGASPQLAVVLSTLAVCAGGGGGSGMKAKVKIRMHEEGLVWGDGKALEFRGQMGGLEDWWTKAQGWGLALSACR